MQNDYGYTDEDIEYRSGIMGVPITFLDKYNPDQFDILGKIDAGEITDYNLAKPIIHGKSLYKRIAIRRRIKGE
ncbi:MAG: adenine-specific methyltransferase EcoRI family protein [Treponema sp.]